MFGRLLLSALATSAAILCLAQDSSSKKVICIDPGHPSETSMGTKGKHTTEMLVNFRIARMLELDLIRQGYKVVMTKDSPRRLVTNKRRAEIANWAKADLFIRLHCDASAGSGFAVYYPAAPGVASDGTKGPSQHVIDISRAAATKFHIAMASALQGVLVDNGLKTDADTGVGGKQGALTGSIFSEVPTLLVEMIVLTNDKDEKWILNRKNPAKLAEALDKGVVAALGESQGN